MWRIHRDILEDNYYTKEVEGEFGCFYDKDELKTYDAIKNKFKNFKLDQEYELELKVEGCQSITYLKFFLYNGEEENIPLFIIRLDVNSLTDLTYEFIPNFTTERKFKDIQDLYSVYGNYLIKIKHETKFYRFQRFEDEDEDEDEDEEEKEIPPVASSYPSDQCVICYAEKPNILNYPCLHISQCEACNEKGRFIKCIICKDEIQYKIKI